MIAYVTIGTNDMERATKFYNALFAELDPGIKVLMDAGRIKLWGKPGAPNFAVATPFDGQRATVGNGVMVALAADSPAKVDAIYKKALELGGTDEGAPGRRVGRLPLPRLAGSGRRGAFPPLFAKAGASPRPLRSAEVAAVLFDARESAQNLPTCTQDGRWRNVTRC